MPVAAGETAVQPLYPEWYGEGAEQFANTISGAPSSLPSLTSNWYSNPLTANLSGVSNAANAITSMASSRTAPAASGATPGVSSGSTPGVSPGGVSTPTPGGGSFSNALSSAAQITSGLGTSNAAVANALDLANGSLGYIDTGAGGITSAMSGYQNLPGYDPEGMNAHLSPYLSGVLNQIQRLGNQNLTENVLPGINSTFAGDGQFGSSRNADFANRAIRDNMREILGAQAVAGNQAYNQASQDYLSWQNSKLAGLAGLREAGSSLGDMGLKKAQGALSGGKLAIEQAALPVDAYSKQALVYTDIDKAREVARTAAQSAASAGARSNAEMDLKFMLASMEAQKMAADMEQEAYNRTYKDWLTQTSTPIDIISSLANSYNTATAGVRGGNVTTSAPTVLSPNSGTNWGGALSVISSLM